MSGAADSNVPRTAIETNREHLERIAASDLPIAADAERTLEFLEEGDENQ